tara:strand:- start:81 stop:1160 length:1080 start_codon:yes stop_codon:yes gene_type:complete
MALTTVHSGKQARLFIAQEDTFGTARSDAAAWATNNQDGVICLQPTGDLSPADLGGVVRNSEIRAHGQRVKKHTDIFVSQNGSFATMPFEVLPTRHDLDFLLMGVMQDIESEEASGTFSKLFTINRDTTQPDFGAISGAYDEGLLMTVTLDDPIASENDQLTSAIISELTLSSDPGNYGGRLVASGNFYSGFSLDHDNNLAPASSIIPDTDYYNHSLLTTKAIESAALGVVNSFSITINNNAQRVGSSTTGNAESYAIGIPEYSITGEMSLKYDSTTKDMVNDFLSGTDRLISLGYGSGTADGSLLIKVNAIYTGHVKEFGGDSGMFLTIPFEAVDNLADSHNALEIQMANSLDRAWTS